MRESSGTVRGSAPRPRQGHGAGFKVKLDKRGLRTKIDDRRFGIPEAGFEIERAEQALPTTVRPFACENGTYRVVSAVFDQTERASATALRPRCSASPA